MELLSETEAENSTGIVRVLHLEDNRTDRELVKILLAAEGIRCEIFPAEDQEGFVRALETAAWDLILADYSLPSFDGYQALEVAKHLSPNTPFIFLTGTLGEDIAVETLKNGATDYVLKQKTTRLGAAVRRALREQAEKLARQEAEEALRTSGEQLRFLAYHDALTRLPNRAFLQEYLPSLLAGARRHKERLALLFIDVDHFKTINDSLGHSAGDLVLREVANRLKQSSREQDTVIRLGGDEFLVVLGSIQDATDAAVAAERILKALAAEFRIQNRSLRVTCSLGISVFPEDGADVETLLMASDLGLYSAKDSGRNNWKFFIPDMNAEAMERLTLENDLHRAIDREQLFIEYQPQVDLVTGKIVGSEALLRWRHPVMKLIPPSKFIPVAENCGEILRIGEWVLRTACEQNMKWQSQGLKPRPIAVNVSAVQFRQSSFAETVVTVLRETGLAPEYLELELTESLLLSNADVVMAVLMGLKQTGLRLSIDDFGTGYSGLSYLRNFQVAKLKIDRSFVQSLPENRDDAAITSAIIGIAKVLQMVVIAEGVETEKQIRFLREHDCDEVQGFYISRPVPPDRLFDMVRSQEN
jgi:diguanylate cyclase (GGDEF)-like protein